MDPRFLVSRDEFHDVQMDVKQVQAIQQSHAERLLRLEKRQADDAALKSVWNSPFPSVLGGTPQHGPVMPPNDVFDDIDEQGQNLLGSLHLDADYEPIRRGAASRANSVRFDESALQGANWAGHNGRHSGEFGPVRPSSGLGGHAMMERSLSHKSDGRHSSAGHSVHSMHSNLSGRASSLGLDTNFVIGGRDEDSPVDIPEPPPGLFYLGSVPSIVRCWLNTDFTSNTLLFAVVCTGSQKSTVDFSLIKELDLTGNIRKDVDGAYRISLPVYLAEARVTQSNSRSPSPAPQLPSITASFEVTGVEQPERPDAKKTIRVFIGSDTLRMHSADLLLSRNLMTLYGNDRDKLSVPFVRPEDDALFKHLATTNVIADTPKLNAAAPEFVSSEKSSKTPSHDADAAAPHGKTADYESSQGLLSPAASQASHHLDKALSANHRLPSSDRGPDTATHKHGAEDRPPETPSSKDAATASAAAAAPSSEPASSTRRESNAAIWGPWRHGGGASGGTGSDGGGGGGMSGYQPAGRSSRSMKVLKPAKSAASASSSSSAAARTAGPPYEQQQQQPLPTTATRTSSEHRRRSGGTAGGTEGAPGSAGPGGGGGGGSVRWEPKRGPGSASGATSSSSGSSKMLLSAAGPHHPSDGGGKSSAVGTTAPRSATNPLGSASAFSFLMGKQKPAAATSGGE